jgi:hypothetical protein
MWFTALSVSISPWFIGVALIFIPFAVITFTTGNGIIIRAVVRCVIMATITSQALATNDTIDIPTVVLFGNEIDLIRTLVTTSHFLLLFHSLAMGAVVFKDRRRKKFRWTKLYSYSAPIISVLGNSASVCQSLLATNGDEPSWLVKKFISTESGWIITWVGMLGNGEDLCDIACVLWWVFRNLVLAFKGLGVMIWRLTMMRWWR